MRVNDLTQTIQKIVSVLLAALMILCLAPEAFLLHAVGSSVQNLTVSTTDGTVPFDTNDNPGYDSDINNGIVRSYDSISYSLHAGFSYSEATVLNIRVTLPAAIQKKVQWDATSLGWATSVQIGEDNTLTAAVAIQPDGAGVENYSMKLNVLGAKNGEMIQPSFTAWLDDNEEGGKTETPAGIRVSARKAYNVMISAYDGSEGVSTITHNGKRVRVYSVGYVVEMMNDSDARGKLGLEFPDGEEISFDLTARIDDAVFMSGNQDDLKPYLFNYTLNGDSNGKMVENNGLITLRNHWYLPYSSYDLTIAARDPEIYSVYDSGSVEAGEISTGDHTCKVNVKIKDFQTNGIFPTRPASTADRNFTAREACFAAGIVYFAISIDGVMLAQDAKFVAEDSDLTVSEESTPQVKTTDDRVSLNFPSSRPGSMSKYIALCDQNCTNYSSNTLSVTGNYRAGDNAAMPGQEFYAWSNWRQLGFDPENEVKSTDSFLAIDGDAFEPVQPSSSKTALKIMNRTSIEEYQLYYVTKPDGGNWTSHEEMKSASAQNLDTVLGNYHYYSTYDEWKASGETCIGFLVKAKTKSLTNEDNVSSYFGFRLKVKAGVDKIGTVYPFYNTIWTWKEGPGNGNVHTSPLEDGAVRNIAAENGPCRIIGADNLKYKPTEYDESGTIKSGTHPDYFNGQSLLIIGGKASIRKETLKKNAEGNPETTYLLSGNNDQIAWGLYPAFEVGGGAIPGTMTTITIEDTLPEGLTYISGSAVQGAIYDESTDEFVGGASLEPRVFGNQLKWTFEISIGEEIPPIFYKTAMDLSITNGTQLENRAVISCPLDSREVTARTGSFTITVASTLAFRLTKSVGNSHLPFDRDLVYDLTITNSSSSYLTGVQVVDILPFNGDPRGSNFAGSYRLKSMTLIEGTGGCAMFVSTSESIRNQANLPTNDFGNTSIWSFRQPDNTQPLDGVTAIGFMPSIEPRTSMTVRIVLAPSGNTGGDIYGNRPYLIVGNSDGNPASVLTGNTVETEIYSSSLEGRVWKDLDGNGIQDAGETGIPGIRINLLSASGAPVTDANNNPVFTTTGPDGKYRFDRIYSGSYKVSAEVDLEEYELSPEYAEGSTDANDSNAVEENGNAVIEQIAVEDFETSGKLLTVKDHQDIGLIPPEEPVETTTTSETTITPEITTEPDVTTTIPETTSESEVTVTTPDVTTTTPEITSKPLVIITSGTNPPPGYGVIISTARPETPPTETLDLGAGISDASKRPDREGQSTVYLILIAAAFASVIGAVSVKKKSKR